MPVKDALLKVLSTDYHGRPVNMIKHIRPHTDVLIQRFWRRGCNTFQIFKRRKFVVIRSRLLSAVSLMLDQGCLSTEDAME